MTGFLSLRDYLFFKEVDGWTDRCIEIDIDSQKSKIKRELILQIGILIVCEVHRTTQCPICHFVVITSLQTTTQMAPSAFMALLPVYTWADFYNQTKVTQPFIW